MKKVILAFAFAIWWAIAAHAATSATSNQYQHINNTWNAPNSVYPNCSATVKTSCLNSYTYTAIDPNGGANIITVPNGGVAAGAQVTYLWGPGGFLYCGTWTTSAVTNYIDSNGANVSSSAVSTTAVVQCPLVPSPATNLQSTPAP